MLNAQAGLFASWCIHIHGSDNVLLGIHASRRLSWATTGCRSSGFARTIGPDPTFQQIWMSAWRPVVELRICETACWSPGIGGCRRNLSRFTTSRLLTTPARAVVFDLILMTRQPRWMLPTPFSRCAPLPLRLNSPGRRLEAASADSSGEVPDRFGGHGPASILPRCASCRRGHARENYRSTEEIVTFCREAGYPNIPELVADWKAHYLTDVPVAVLPIGHAVMFSDLSHLGSDHRCVVSCKRRTKRLKQPFRSDLVASIAWLLSGRMSSRLVNERDATTGVVRPLATLAYSAEGFWQLDPWSCTPSSRSTGARPLRLQELFRVGPIGTHSRRRRYCRAVQGQQRDASVMHLPWRSGSNRGRRVYTLRRNRFNVMASRARKLIVLVSQQVVDHLAATRRLRESRLLKSFVETFCNVSAPVRLACRMKAICTPWTPSCARMVRHE